MLNLLKLLKDSKPYFLNCTIGLQINKIPILTRNKASG